MRKVLTYSILLPLLALLSSCVANNLQAEYEQYLKEKAVSEGSAKEEWEPTECTIDDVKFTSFKVLASLNEDVLYDLSFTSDTTVNANVAIVDHYFLPTRHLIASWQCVAARVTVDEVDQQTGVTVNDFTSTVRYRLYASDGQYKQYAFRLEQKSNYTGMPCFSIITGNNNFSKQWWSKGTLKISGQQSGYDDVSHTMSVKLRGNAAAAAQKKSFTVRLDEGAMMLGLPKHKRWCLVANANDRTQLRNRVAYEIASRTALSWTPASRYCEVFINGYYYGLYLMTEQIRVDKNRVNITEMQPGDTTDLALTGGYLLECDRYVDSVSFKTAVRELPINVKSPDAELITPAHMEYLENYFRKIEQLLYYKDDPDPEYRDYIDIASFADAWIVLELTHCRDAKIPGSVWYYKDRGGKLFAGPVWDFDLATFIKSTEFLLYDYETTDFSSTTTRSLWYSRLFRDEVFRAEVKRRWELYYPVFATIPAYIDEQAALISASAEANFAVWRNIKGNNDDDLSWSEAVELMKENYTYRLEFLNSTISAW